MTNPLRLLIVEDSEDDALLLVRELRRDGYDVTFERVDTPEAMTAALANQMWDVIISDYSMPHFSGTAALELLKQTGLDIPFILVSGTIGEDLAVESMKQGAADYLLKDRLARLGPAVAHALEQKQLRDERKRAEEARQALYQATLDVLEPLPLRARLDRLLQTVRDVFNVDRLNILLADPEGKWLQAVASLGTEEPLEAIRVPMGPPGGGIAQAYLTKRASVWDGRGPVPEELRLKPPYDRIKAFRSRVFANVPLVVQGRAIGVLGADQKYSRRPLDHATLKLLQHFAGQAAIAIEHARLYEELRLAAIQLEAKVEDRTQELRAANALLEEASRFKSEFLANMSHELRTPLNSIIGFSELLEDQGFGPLTEKQNRYVHNVWTSGKHLLELINDILDLSKVEAGKIELHMETFSLREALVAALTMVRPQAAKKRISLRSEIVAERTVTADPLRLKQIMYNLLSNAIKFTPEGGQVSVAARTAQDAVVEIAVTDMGIGIKAEDLSKLFREFSQVGGEHTRGQQGTGLGLALSKRLVELHGGQIWVESEGENKGSTFTFTLPVGGPTSDTQG